MKLHLLFSTITFVFRNIKVNYKRNLIEVKPDKKEAVFENLDTGEKETYTVRSHFIG